MKVKHLIAAALLLVLGACQGNGGGAATTNATEVPSERVKVSDTAVASYREKVPDKLNDWYFSVELFELKSTFDYVSHVRYEEMERVDTIHFPNLGYAIKPAVQKGPDALTCYIGFISPKGEFMYLKSAYVEDSKLFLHTVRTYTTTEKSGDK